MILKILVFLILVGIFGLGVALKLTIALFIAKLVIKGAIWLCIKLPVGLTLVTLGLAMSITILLAPIGLPLAGTGLKLMIPG